ncbi:hypothetical protein, partial [Tersicoccus solisilvae]
SKPCCVGAITMSESTSSKKQELMAHGLIIFMLFPALTITGISLYGLIIWIMLALGGVASH